MNGLVLDVEVENGFHGARVEMRKQNSGHSDHQLWYDDSATGTIRSKLNDFCLDWDGKHTLHYTAPHTRRYPAHNIIIDQLYSPSGRQIQRNDYRKINNK